MNENIQEKAIQSSGGQPGQKEPSLGKGRMDGASTSAASTVGAPSAGVEPAKQLVSGTSSDGTKTVDGASSSEGKVEDGPAVTPEVGASSGAN
ncbi:trans-sialidase, putative,c71 surface protein, putative, partial [Trypanosoma cruzi marinkellei]